eukprot:TRINITY_DN13946_c0_g1_i1.p3 TRINITY_DN13946_c0_g1~~TRINITY_DN13946_c0_g1_i1.p3  ORF type:complete len:87 (-),score=10.10 TRINITY_DN13946_c0_g1_i1:73-333(-)
MAEPQVNILANDAGGEAQPVQNDAGNAPIVPLKHKCLLLHFRHKDTLSLVLHSRQMRMADPLLPPQAPAHPGPAGLQVAPIAGQGI